MAIHHSIVQLTVFTIAIIAPLALCVSAKETVSDADGNNYTTVTIGSQIWTVENLATTKYNDGSPLPLVTDRSQWQMHDDSALPAYCWYENDEQNKKTYGALYNWYTVHTGKLAPKGWHVPTDSEWTMLERFLIEKGYNWDSTTSGNKIAKAMAAQKAWSVSNDSGVVGNDLSKNNRSGFSALPGGFRLDCGDFFDIGIHAYWWSTTEYNESRVWRRALYYDKNNLIRNHGTLRNGCGFSVRLVKDRVKTD